MSKLFQGLYTAQITPFKNGKVDYDSLEKMLVNQINSNVDGIVICGSTGEASTLSSLEYEEIIKFSSSILKGNTQFIVGVSSNDLDSAIKKSDIACENGADGLMIVTPYYNKPPQRGIFEYFKILHDKTTIPIIIYSVPSRTGVDFSDETIISLSKLKRILALKDAGNDLERPFRLYKKIPSDFSLLSGEDTTSCAYSANGGVGVISVISNIFPKICKEIQDHLTKNNFFEALEKHIKLRDIYSSMNCETNPIPIKYAASLLGLCTDELRLPLSKITDINIKNNIEKSLKNFKDINNE